MSLLFLPAVTLPPVPSPVTWFGTKLPLSAIVLGVVSRKNLWLALVSVFTVQ